jgi:hypothetical protein
MVSVIGKERGILYEVLTVEKCRERTFIHIKHQINWDQRGH